MGTLSVAAPLLDAGGRAVAALSLVDRSQRADLRRLAPAVQTAARAAAHCAAARASRPPPPDGQFGSLSGYGTKVLRFSSRSSRRPIGAAARWGQVIRSQVLHPGPIGVAASVACRSMPAE